MNTARKTHDSERPYEIAAPDPGALIESLRAFGYDLGTALADLVDNSIAAKSRNIWIDATWAGQHTTISVTDDGAGMSPQDLLQAMRPGSKGPSEARAPEDLGRFGLGLKTASFSQCRKLTVRSKTAETPAAQYCWDLAYVAKCGEWRVLTGTDMESERHLLRLGDLSCGTAVLWEELDRLVAGDDVEDAKAQNVFLSRLEEAKCHLAMVFHRYLRGQRCIRLYVNSRPVEPWDPFLEAHPATQPKPREPLGPAGHEIYVSPFILPHHSKLSTDEHTSGGGLRGWNALQGFYVYRNRRLLVAGDWLGLGYQKEEHCKLARIRIDIPNSLDEEWAIDVRKATAHPPKAIRHDLKRIAKLTREGAADIYRHRGKVIARARSAPDVFLWANKRKHGKHYYRINREHPLVADAIAAQPHKGKTLRALLRCLEETVPVPLIVINQAESPDGQSVPFEGVPAEEILSVMQEVLESLVRSGLPLDRALSRLSVMEPFDRYVEFISILREKWEDNK